mgnify:CR=1 FL=1
MGKIIFTHIEDGTAKIQVLIKSDDIGGDSFKFALKHFDIGDFVEITGTLFVANKVSETSFEVHITNPNLQDITFDYWIIN